MKLSCVTRFAGHQWKKVPMKKAFKAISEAGFQAAEITACVPEQANPDKMTHKDIRRLKKTLDNYNLELSAFCSVYPKNMSHISPDEIIRRRSLEFTKKLIDLAVNAGTQILVWGSGYARNTPQGFPRYKSIKWITQLLKKSGKYADDRGIIIAIEPLNKGESNFINTVAEALDLVKKVNVESVRVMCDSVHMNIEEACIRDAIVEAKNRLAHVHVADNGSRIPGRGHIDFDEIFNALKEIRYDGYITLEAILGKNIKEELREAQEYLMRFI